MLFLLLLDLSFVSDPNVATLNLFYNLESGHETIEHVPPRYTECDAECTHTKITNLASPIFIASRPILYCCRFQIVGVMSCHG